MKTKLFKAMILSTLLSAFATAASARTIEIGVNGLVCAFCAQGVEKKLKKFPATSAVFVSLEQKLVAVELNPGMDINDAALKKAIVDSGYALVSIRRTDTPLAALRSAAGGKPTGEHKHE